MNAEPCAQCGQAKPPEDFGLNRAGGRRTLCRVCMGLRISDGMDDADAQSYLLDPDNTEPMYMTGARGCMPYIRYPTFEPDATALLDSLTLMWGTHGVTR